MNGVLRFYLIAGLFFSVIAMAAYLPYALNKTEYIRGNEYIQGTKKLEQLKREMWGERILIVREIGFEERKPTGQCVIWSEKIDENLKFAGYEPVGVVKCDERIKHNAEFSIRVNSVPPPQTQ